MSRDPEHDAKERTIAELSQQFAEDNLDMEEFERRVTLAHRAASATELKELLHDLPGDPARFEAIVRVDTSGTEHALAARKSTALVVESDVRAVQKLTAIFGGVQRGGTWSVARQIVVRTIMGGAQLDFREAWLPAGVTHVRIVSVMGGVHIIVPPELAVEVDGHAIFGGFEHLERVPSDPEPSRPILRVTGFALMGGVNVETRLPGESRRHARRRARRERRAERALERSERKLLRDRN